ncbi:hypothetical protein Rvan_1454 [Rhodomicrobium vannielii ATCC 17100]|uniref:Uncharacterized protein n=1 Tax=Rhodomicrobium vannielii (strain ATCC 17100 / DSM 162 / LMG 4299 / NCIMB 10020 / ATH 3.1.1) TaxID=648757 RepID=E3I758_RHOVT|nr:hypothetical protein [Rhodomicrobium vannielii]ADP70709.1 hypothetical protein Rvan_1454 [Rhodomicrobium vannielii ATCC 17100]
MNSPLKLKRRDTFNLGLGPAMEEFMDEKQIPALVVPEAVPQDVADSAPRQAVVHSIAPQPEPVRLRPKPVRPKAEQSEPDAASGKRTSITIYAPEYVSKALRKRAFEKDMTVTAYILHALALAKIPVRKEDLLCDGRKSDSAARIDILRD